jgi:predicted solute-binding protein
MVVLKVGAMVGTSAVPMVVQKAEHQVDRWVGL